MNDELMNWWIDELMNRWIDELMNRWIDDWANLKLRTLRKSKIEN